MNQPDYHALIDAEMWTYIERVDGTYPPGAVDMTITEQRNVYDSMCKTFSQGRPAGVQAFDETHGAVPCRRPKVIPAMRRCKTMTLPACRPL